MLLTGSTLDGFANDSTQREGIALDWFEAGAIFSVKTRRSHYRLAVLDPARRRVLAEGGIFPHPTEVELSGATCGGSALKLGWILVGLRIEFRVGTRRITSSPVERVTLESAAPPNADQRAA